MKKLIFGICLTLSILNISFADEFIMDSILQLHYDSIKAASQGNFDLACKSQNAAFNLAKNKLTNEKVIDSIQHTRTIVCNKFQQRNIF